jgi:hypothetical protein
LGPGKDERVLVGKDNPSEMSNGCVQALIDVFFISGGYTIYYYPLCIGDYCNILQSMSWEWIEIIRFWIMLNEFLAIHFETSGRVKSQEDYVNLGGSP